MASDLSPADLPFLATLARSPRPADRRLWLRVATDYFLTSPFQTLAHGAEFAAALSEGLRDADDATRCALARKLAPCAEAADVLATLESLGGEAALHVLQCATVLPRERLLAAAAGDDARARAVARRDDLDAELVRILADHDEIEVLLALARNRRAPIDARLYAALARRAQQRIDGALDRRLAEALLDRGPTGLEQAALFLEADSSQRAEIMTVAQRAALGGPRTPVWRRETSEAIAGLERFALGGEPERFAGALAEALDCSHELAERIARDSSGEPLAVALAALGAPNDVTVRILTSRDLQDGADYRRVGALARLKDALNPAAAELVVAAMIGDSARPRARCRPVLDPGASATPSRPLGPAANESLTRAGPRNWIKETALTPAALRRRRAFAFASGRRFFDDPA
ncbi:MAG: DUF2336 domain-containing protein [Roseiarcus sp.]